MTFASSIRTMKPKAVSSQSEVVAYAHANPGWIGDTTNPGNWLGDTPSTYGTLAKYDPPTTDGWFYSWMDQDEFTGSAPTSIDEVWLGVEVATDDQSGGATADFDMLYESVNWTYALDDVIRLDYLVSDYPDQQATPTKQWIERNVMAAHVDGTSGAANPSWADLQVAEFAILGGAAGASEAIRIYRVRLRVVYTP